MEKEYRNGPVGALMDEYERAVAELETLLLAIPRENFIRIVDRETEDPDCRSVQTIMDHTVKAGYGYANYIRRHFKEALVERKDSYEVDSPQESCVEMDKMMSYTLESLDGKWEMSHSDLMQHEMKSTWGQLYDFEQLLEHAIVHILRHRRQIERFLLCM